MRDHPVDNHHKYLEFLFMDNSLIKDETNAMGWTFNETIDNNLLFTYSSLGCGSETVQFQIPLLDLVSQVEYLILDVYKSEIVSSWSSAQSAFAVEKITVVLVSNMHYVVSLIYARRLHI